MATKKEETLAHRPHTYKVILHGMEWLHPKDDDLSDEATSPSGVDLETDAISAEESLNIAPKRKVLARNSEGDANSSARKRPKLTEDNNVSSTATKEALYPKMGTRIRNGRRLATHYNCEAQVQELRKAVDKMNDTLGRVLENMKMIVEKLDAGLTAYRGSKRRTDDDDA
ncbi:hypothetical protein ACQKWADRAFT_327313 [Trichoderma austrokoningii]